MNKHYLLHSKLQVTFIIKYLGNCPALCPTTTCPRDYVSCPGGTDFSGCPMVNTCVSTTQVGNDGSVCPVSCPVICPEDHMMCDGGVNDNGCPMPSTCVANSGI